MALDLTKRRTSLLQQNLQTILKQRRRSSQELVLTSLDFSIGCCDTTWLVIGHGNKRQHPRRGRVGTLRLKSPPSQQIQVVAAKSTGGAKFIVIHAVPGTPKVEPHVTRWPEVARQWAAAPETPCWAGSEAYLFTSAWEQPPSQRSAGTAHRAKGQGGTGTGKASRRRRDVAWRA